MKGAKHLEGTANLIKYNEQRYKREKSVLILYGKLN